jgi:hypothetical protein
MFKRSAPSHSGRVPPAPIDLEIDGPYLCLVYESEEERNELAHRLREARLDGVPWRFVDLRADRRLDRYLGSLKRWSKRPTDVLGAGSVATMAAMVPHWPFIAAVTLTVVPLALMLSLLRGFGLFRPTTTQST